MASKCILAVFVLVGLVATIQAAFDFDNDDRNRGSSGSMMNRDRNSGMMNSGSSMSNRDRNMMGSGSSSMGNRDRDMMGNNNGMRGTDRDRNGMGMGAMGSGSSMRGMGGRCNVDKRMNQDCVGCRGKGGCTSDTCARGMGTMLKKNPENCKKWCCA
ncbi:hypothetical protein RvY_16785 [Ramazzottius varieornatus]|uniref:Uncharacterized protein n=1 Tax=Ramazzottius varieornatus TaxID=947166 RepID=A0A1D1VZR5_RAMVA|nr:hypothetical protein RvY_16785 [Ramazzottius varieornatus]